MSHKKNFAHQISHAVYIALYGVLIAFTILFHNSANLGLYAGSVILLLGIALLLLASRSRKESYMSDGKETLVESGVYAIIRHPEFLGHALVILAIVLIS